MWTQAHHSLCVALVISSQMFSSPRDKRKQKTYKKGLKDYRQKKAVWGDNVTKNNIL